MRQVRRLLSDRRQFAPSVGNLTDRRRDRCEVTTRPRAARSSEVRAAALRGPCQAEEVVREAPHHPGLNRARRFSVVLGVVDHVDGGFLRGGGAAVDADVGGVQLVVGVFA